MGVDFDKKLLIGRTKILFVLIMLTNNGCYIDGHRQNKCLKTGLRVTAVLFTYDVRSCQKSKVSLTKSDVLMFDVLLSSDKFR